MLTAYCEHCLECIHNKAQDEKHSSTFWRLKLVLGLNASRTYENHDEQSSLCLQSWYSRRQLLGANVNCPVRLISSGFARAVNKNSASCAACVLRDREQESRDTRTSGRGSYSGVAEHQVPCGGGLDNVDALSAVRHVTTSCDLCSCSSASGFTSKLNIACAGCRRPRIHDALALFLTEECDGGDRYTNTVWDRLTITPYSAARTLSPQVPVWRLLRLLT